MWCSYRKDFPAIAGTGATTDAGWGCTLRTAQMLVAQALSAHVLGDAWRTGCATDEPRPRDLRRVVRLFADAPSAPLSVHAMARTGRDTLGMRVGEWYGPASVAAVVRAIVDARRPAGLRCCVAQDGTVYADSVRAVGAAAPFLLLVPLRLGPGDAVHARLLPGLALLFRLPQSVGVVGGRPRSSLYFVAMEGTSTLYYLDPHTVQPYVAVPEEAEEREERGGEEDSVAFDASSWACQGVRRMAAADIDPSIAAGFYFHGMDDFEEFRAALERTVPQEERLFSIEDFAPSEHGDGAQRRSQAAVVAELTESMLDLSAASPRHTPPPQSPTTEARQQQQSAAPAPAASCSRCCSDDDDLDDFVKL